MSACKAVITCLPNPAASVSDVGEKLPLVRNGKIWMKMLVTDEAELKRLGAEVIQSQGKAVDCPVSGGCHRAETGHSSIFAGCYRLTFEMILPLLNKTGR